MYFIAVLAPDEIDKEVLKWKIWMRDRFGCIVALKSPAHITLISPFWMEPHLQENLQKSIDAFSATREMFSVELENFDSFKPRVIFVQVKNTPVLDSLKSEFEQHLLQNPAFPVKSESRAFHPHVTIANRDLHKKDFSDAWNYFKNKTFRTSFQVNGITLLRHNGLRWDAVHTGSFPLM